MTSPEDRTPYVPGQPTPTDPHGIWATTAPIGSRAAGPAAPTKSRAPWLIAGTLAALLIAGAVTGILIASRPAHVATATSTGDVQTPVEEHGVQAPADVCGYLEDLCATTEPAAPAPGPTLHASDMTLTLKTTRKKCYGYGVGCSLTVQVEADRKDGVPAPSPDETWLVTYEIRGAEDGPIIGSFEVTGGQYTVNEETLDTASSKSKVTVKVTDVEKVGL